MFHSIAGGIVFSTGVIPARALSTCSAAESFAALREFFQELAGNVPWEGRNYVPAIMYGAIVTAVMGARVQAHEKRDNATTSRGKEVLRTVQGMPQNVSDLNQPPFGGENFHTNPILPAPYEFISPKSPAVP
jgi:hypothetical protein